MRSRSDESLSIRGRVGKEPLTSSAPSTKPAAMKKNLLSTDPLPDKCMRNSNGRAVSVTYEVVRTPESDIPYPPPLNRHCCTLSCPLHQSQC